jgi:hypothetical protein
MHKSLGLSNDKQEKKKRREGEKGVQLKSLSSVKKEMTVLFQIPKHCNQSIYQARA